ncbi:hypothetical protein AXF42_Ash006479 [Apostasia shenzhenica]|uniref:Shugoshin C-terminal domain-containing protein n=1 Tax=Apostasia shenzhenica TaxID=1088818 RepID=A0A2I0AZ87_9ASPA|nr:hypothetical protein AXF42_Ash006479 [Apostasia shenzhenica]
MSDNVFMVGLKLKVAQHELGCQSAALRAQTLELEELKEKFNKQDKLLSKFTSIQNKEIKPVESTANDACHSHLVSSHTKQCSANRKRTHRSRMLGPMPITSPTTRKEKDGNSRKTIRRKSVGLRAESCEPNEDLFEIPLSLGGRDDRDSNDDDENLPRGDGVQGRRSIGRPLRKAAERVNSYKELPLKAKLRRSE